MSNVKVNGNTYNGVESVKLELADGTGYVTYSEGQVTSDITNDILNGNISGDYRNEEITTLNLACFAKTTVGTLDFPNVTKCFGKCNINAENILLPNLSDFDTTINHNLMSFAQSNITGTLDLSGFVSKIGLNQTFYNAKIGTLLIGKMVRHNMMFTNATIENLVWANDETGSDGVPAIISAHQGLISDGVKITNAYVADSVYEAVKAKIDDGTITTVTNLYKVSEWSE